MNVVGFDAKFRTLWESVPLNMWAHLRVIYGITTFPEGVSLTP